MVKEIGLPSYRWTRNVVDFKDPNVVYKTVEMFEDVLIDVAADGTIIGVEAYGHELEAEDLMRVLADPHIQYIFPREET